MDLLAKKFQSPSTVLPNLLLGHDVYAGIETLTKTNWNQMWGIPVKT